MISVEPAALMPGEVLQRSAFRAMGCTWSIWLAARDRRNAALQMNAASALVEAIEARLSRFRPDSELCALNERAGEAFVASPLLYTVVSFAVAAAAATDGLLDPTVLPSLEAIGYDRSFTEVRDSPSPPGHPTGGIRDWRDLRLDPKGRTITIPDGARLDLGGIAKGWVAESVADSLAGLGPCLVDAGGDISARGARTWDVGVANPLAAEDDIAGLSLRDGAVATSGTDYRRWRRGDRIVHHIIDPRTHGSADTDLISVTVIANSLAWAEVHAKAALILGSSGGSTYLRRRGLEGLLVRSDGARLQTDDLSRYMAS